MPASAMTQQLLLLLMLLASSLGALRKCCARSELLVWDGATQRFECGARARDGNEAQDMLRDTHAWVPRNTVRFQDADDADDADADRVNAFLLSAQVQFDARPTCSPHAQDALVQYLDAEQNEFSLVAMDDGQVSLEVLKESSLHNPAVAHAQLFPASTFCVDACADHGAHAVLLCPCSARIPCVRKCCEDSFAFAHHGATVAPTCESVGKLPYTVYDWLPGISNDTADSIRYYRLTQAQPECARKQMHVIKNQLHEDAKFYLLPGGGIQAVDTGRVYTVDSYCGEFTTRNYELVYFCADAVADGSGVRGALLAVGACAYAAALVTLLIAHDRPNSVFGCALTVHVAMATLSLAARAALELLASAQPGHSASAALGLCAQFCAVSASLWLAALAADVATAFGGAPGRVPSLPLAGRPLLGYAVLTCSVAALTTAGAGVAEFVPGDGDVHALRPWFGHPNAFINGRAATWLFLYGPIVAALALAVCLALFSHASLRRRRQRHGSAGGGDGYQLALPSDGNIDCAGVGSCRLRTLTLLVAMRTATCALELGSFCACSTSSSHWLVSAASALVAGVATLLVVGWDRRAPATLRRAMATLRSADKMAARGFQHGRLELQDMD